MSRDYDEPWPDDDDTPTVACSNCGADVYEEADSCPACGEFLIGDSAPLQSKPMWYVALGLVGIVAVVLVLSGVLNLL